MSPFFILGQKDSETQKWVRNGKTVLLVLFKSTNVLNIIHAQLIIN